MNGQNTLAKRVADLERSVGAAVMQTICIALVGVDPEKTGPERAIQYPVVGYRTTDGAKAWWLTVGETPERLRERIRRESAIVDGPLLLVECYEDERA